MSNGAPIQVCFALDEGFVRPTLIAVYSLFKNTSRKVDLHVFGYELSAQSWSDFEKLAGGFQQNLIVHKLDKTSISLPNEHRISHISSASFLRLLLPDFLDGEVIYLDGDISVCADIGEMADIDMKGYIALAAPDANVVANHRKNKYKAGAVNIQEILGISDIYDQFNAGILKLDLTALKQSPDILKKFTDIDHIINEGRGRDQVHLNIVLKGRFLRIPLAWNAQYTTQKVASFLPDHERVEWDEARLNPKIIHHTGAKKPWHSLRKSLRARNWRRVLGYKKLMREFDRFMRAQ